MEQFQELIKKWQSLRITSVSDLDNALDSFKVEFAYNSGKIENDKVTYHDTREIFENGKVTGYTGETRAIFEQQNQKLCYEYLKEKIVSKEPLSMELLKETHRILTAGTYDERRFLVNNERPGEFKKHDYVVGKDEIGAAPQDVEQEISELLEEVCAYSGAEILTLAAYFHCKFESIHPFADGNGRTGRTLMNYILMTHDYPPVVIYNDDKPVYVECLNKFDTQGEIDAMVSFLRYEISKTWIKYFDRSQHRQASDKKLDGYVSKHRKHNDFPEL